MLREYNFFPGYETDELPEEADPTESEDVVSKGYADEFYAKTASWGDKVTNIAALKAIASADRLDRQTVKVSEVGTGGTLYQFEADSVATGDDDEIVQPNSGTGRWIKASGSGGSGGGSASGVESLEQKLDVERYGNQTDPLQNSVGSSFSNPVKVVLSKMITAYTNPATTAVIVHDPVYLDDADQNTDSITGWTVQGAAINLAADSGDKILGAASLTFDKDNSGTNARIRFDRGAVDLVLVNNTYLVAGFKVSTIANFSNFEARILVDTSNYQTYLKTTDHTGAAITAGNYHIMIIDLLNDASTATGAGWDPSKLAQYVDAGYNTSSGAQTGTAHIDAIHFSMSDVEKYIQKGSIRTIYDNTNIADFQIDEASARVHGLVTLTAALGFNFAAGVNMKRSTLLLSDGNGGAYMEDGLSGAAADRQVVRTQRILPETFTGNLRIITQVNTNMYWEVKQVNSGTSIDLYDDDDSSTELVAGKIIHVVAVNYNSDGVGEFSYRELDLTVSSSSHLAGITTVITGTNTGIIAGDFVILKPATTKVSLTPLGDNEAYVAPTFEKLKVNNLGLPFPFEKDVFAYYDFAGGDFTLNKKGIGPDLNAVVGTSGPLSTTKFTGDLTGIRGFASGGSGTYLTQSPANTIGISGDATTGDIIVSVLFKVPSSFTGDIPIVNRFAIAGGGRGWSINASASAGEAYIYCDTVVTLIGSLIMGGLNHVVLYVKTGTDIKAWTNSVVGFNGTGTVTDNVGSNFYIGVNEGGGFANQGFEIAQVLIVRNPVSAPTQSMVRSLYNRGLARYLGMKPGVTYEETKNGVSGRTLGIQTELGRTTDIATPFVQKHGAIQD